MNDPVDLSTPEPSLEPTPDSPSGPKLLDHLALFAVRGADARSFLDNQLTRNVPTLEAGQSTSRASIAGYCSPKGRLLATLLVWSELSSAHSSAASSTTSSDRESIFVLTSRDIGETIAKRWRMYVLRAKVTIEDVTAMHAIEGFHDLPARLAAAASLDTGSVLRDGEATWIRHPDSDGLKRFMRIGTAPIEAPDSPAASVHAATWRWSEIRAGIPRITASTQDRFVPQMVNLEALDGVDFRKGCFPGQEVVARSQYLGKLKRRMALAHIDGSAMPQAGTDTWSVEDNGPVGLVVNAERGSDGRVALLVEIPLALFQSHALRIGQADGPALKLDSLPYELPDNEVFVRPKL